MNSLLEMLETFPHQINSLGPIGQRSEIDVELIHGKY